MPKLADFRGVHHGEAIVVCGLGRSLHDLAQPQRFRTIGVNDIERAFQPTYMFCMDAPKTFAPDRLHYIQHSTAEFIFTDHDLGISRANIVRFPIRRAEAPHFDDPDALYFTARPITSPYIALCLAAHMGAKAIGLIGVDFTDHHFFAADGSHKLTKGLPGIDRRFYLLGSALLERGVKVFNLSLESRLRAFPRLTVEDFFELQQSGRTRAWTRPAERLYFYSSVPVPRSVTELTRLINLNTPLSCRVNAPGSPDIAPGQMRDIEQTIADESSVDLDCETAPLPARSPTSEEFVGIWQQQVAPLLFGATAKRRSLHQVPTMRVIVSQEHAAADELADTVSSILRDLSDADELTIVARHGSSDHRFQQIVMRGSAPWMEQAEGESFVAARNRAARGCSRDILVFTDANARAPEQWASPLLAPFREHHDVAAVGPGIADMYRPHLQSFGMMFADAELTVAPLSRRDGAAYPAPLLPGTFLAVRRSAFEQLGGFDSGMRQSGADDLELCLRLWTSGLQCFVAPDVSVAWMDPFVSGALRVRDYWQDLLHNLLRLATVHFCPERLGAFIRAAALHPEYAAVAAGLASADLAQRRREVLRTRRHSDDWFFNTFAA
jgi:hypothetical protein